RGAASDLARAFAVARGGAIGLHRFSVAQLAARLAAPVLAARGIAPVSYIGGGAGRGPGARGAALGLHRFSVAQLAARLAAPVLAARGIAPVSYIGGEAVAARATFEA